MIVTTAAGAAVLFVVLHAYTPAAVERSAREVLESITGMEVRLSGGRLVAAGRAEFAECVFLHDGREVLSVAPLSIHGALKPSGEWDVENVTGGTWRFKIDLHAPDLAVDTVNAFFDVFESFNQIERPGAGRPDPDKGREPVSVAVCYGHGHGVPLEYCGQAMLEPSLSLRLYRAAFGRPAPGAFPIQGSHAPAAPRLRARRGEVTFEDEIHEGGEPLTKAVLAAQTPDVSDIIAAAPGKMKAQWTREGETVELSAGDEWPLGESDVASQGVEPPAGRLDVGLRSLRFEGGRLAQASGRAHFETARIGAGVLREWLSAAGAAPGDFENGPEYFESVTLSAEFEVSNGLLRVRPAPGAPGLVWASVDGEDIVIFTGSGEVPLARFIERAAKIEPPAAEAPGAASDGREDERAEDGDDPHDAAPLHPVEKKKGTVLPC